MSVNQLRKARVMAAITTFSSTSFGNTDSLQNHHGELFDDGKTFDSFSVCMSKLSSCQVYYLGPMCRCQSLADTCGMQQMRVSSYQSLDVMHGDLEREMQADLQQHQFWLTLTATKR